METKKRDKSANADKRRTKSVTPSQINPEVDGLKQINRSMQEKAQKSQKLQEMLVKRLMAK